MFTISETDKIVKFSFEKKKKLIKLLHNKGIISITNGKELNMLAQNIGIFAHDVTDDEIKSINKGDSSNETTKS